MASHNGKYYAKSAKRNPVKSHTLEAMFSSSEKKKKVNQDDTSDDQIIEK